jgi:exopolyphosphatase/guanosine-5'-triphosphate,3'-diphosphate pyrophosphatase
MIDPTPASASPGTETVVGARVACVDTGSNGIRFQAAEITGSTSYSILEFERVPIRLGHQVFLDGKLAADTMEATVKAFASFRERIDRLGVQHFRAIATSAVREAHNRDLLVDRIFRETGIQLEIITGSEEARLVHVAVSSRIDLSGGKWVMVDLGGGSVEVSLVDDSGMLWSESHTMGSVRLLEELSEVANTPGSLRKLFSEYISVLRIPAPAQYWEPSGFIATGGNIESLAELASAKEDAGGVGHLPLVDLGSAIELLSRLSYAERIEQLKLREDRADVILPAALVYQRLAELSRTTEILVPHVGVKDGLILDMADRLFSLETQEVRYENQIRQAAVSMGRRYMFDEAHGTKVADLAGSIFDQLHALHGRSEHDRLLLTVASILHDVGSFVAMKGHHKHSLYIISRSEIPGLSGDDMILIGHIARYHRGMPSRHHAEFMALSAADRIRVSQLASLLRIANGLDKQHRQVVTSVTVTADNGELSVAPMGTGDLLLERWAVGRKTKLFKETFGLDIRVA